MSLPAQPCINPNPDIAGIGVRVSIYLQAFISLIPAALAFGDGRLSHSESGILRATFTSTLLTACALLLSAFIQVTTYGLSVYHTVIVLNLSWINNTNAITCIILQRAETERDGDEEKPNRCCHRMMWELRFRSKSGELCWSGILACVHSFIMASLGLWLWVNIREFGVQPECTPQTFMNIVGYNIPVTGRVIRIVSIVFYAIMANPLGNVRLFHFFIDISVIAIVLFYIVVIRLVYCKMADKEKRAIARCQSHILVATVIDIIFIVNTELTIWRSRKLVRNGESQWTFGQTLSMLMLVPPLMEVMTYSRKVKDKQNAPGRGAEGVALEWRSR